MPINVSEAIDLDTAERITVERRSPGARVGGLYVPGATSTFKALASEQQPTPRDLQTLPEGERVKNPKMFICTKKIQTASEDNSTLADVIISKGVRFKVIGLADWLSYGHNVAFAVKEQ